MNSSISGTLPDQMRAVVVADQRLDGGPLIANPELSRFAHHWGFRPRACRPYRAKTKGKVERPIRYVRDSFFYGRDFISDDDLDILEIVDTAEEAAEILLGYYHRECQ